MNILTYTLLLLSEHKKGLGLKAYSFKPEGALDLSIFF
jgi:hypothetical protein